MDFEVGGMAEADERIQLIHNGEETCDSYRGTNVLGREEEKFHGSTKYTKLDDERPICMVGEVFGFQWWRGSCGQPVDVGKLEIVRKANSPQHAILREGEVTHPSCIAEG